MAGNLPVTGGYEVKLTWTLAGTPAALNILHFIQNPITAMTQARADAISTAIKGSFTTSGHVGNIWTSVALATVSTRYMGTNEDPWYVGTGAPVPGTSAENPLPAATSCVISLTTGLRGRSFNGRVYLWGFTELANDAAGGISLAAGNSARVFVEGTASSTATAQGWQPAVLSRFHTPPGGAAAVERNPPVLTQVTGYILKDSRWDVQRRRAVAGI